MKTESETGDCEMDRNVGFDAARAAKCASEWIADWFERNGRGCTAVVGISGGKDSSVVAALCARALGADRVLGVLMPNGVQKDIDDARAVCAHLGIRSLEYDISGGYDALMSELACKMPEISEQTRINIQPRIRMTVLYAVAQSQNGRVANTCNLSEDWVGYSTRYGDSAGDFSPISCFTVTEVRAIGRALGLPSRFTDKLPADGLSGKSDEEKLGFSYDVLDRYIRTGEIGDPDTKRRIDRLHELNLFKLRYMDCYRPDGF